MSWIIILKGKNSTYSFGIGSQQINQNSNFQCCKMLLTNNSFYYQIELNVRACAHVSTTIRIMIGKMLKKVNI